MTELETLMVEKMDEMRENQIRLARRLDAMSKHLDEVSRQLDTLSSEQVTCAELLAQHTTLLEPFLRLSKN